MTIEMTIHNLTELLSQLRDNPFLTDEERVLLATIERTAPHMSLGPIMRMVEIVGRLHTLTDIRRNPPPNSPLSGALWRRSDSSTDLPPDSGDNRYH